MLENDGYSADCCDSGVLLRGGGGLRFPHLYHLDFFSPVVFWFLRGSVTFQLFLFEDCFGLDSLNFYMNFRDMLSAYANKLVS